MFSKFRNDCIPTSYNGIGIWLAQWNLSQACFFGVLKAWRGLFFGFTSTLKKKQFKLSKILSNWSMLYSNPKRPNALSHAVNMGWRRYGKNMTSLSSFLKNHKIIFSKKKFISENLENENSILLSFFKFCNHYLIDLFHFANFSNFAMFH